MEDGKTQLTFLTVIEMLQNIPRRKKLSVSELEKSGTGDHQSILFFFFLACSSGCCWLLLAINRVSSLCAVLHVYRVLTCCLLLGSWHCGRGDGFICSQLLFLTEALSAEWERGNRQQYLAIPLLFEKFMG